MSVPSGTKFIGIASNVDTLERKSVQANSPSQVYTVEDLSDTIKPYKVYTALLTQSGDGTSTYTSGTLDVGKTYEITDYQAGDDFSNVANVISGTINTTGCVFIATGDTPTEWSNSTEIRDTSAPVATVLENTLGGEVVWSYTGVGDYIAFLENIFVENKTYFSIIPSNSSSGFLSYNTFQIGWNDIDTIYVSSRADNSPSDGILYNTSIEIRVYN